MIFSFGSKKQKSSSKQQSSTFVDPSQQPFLQDVRRNAQSLYNQGGMPVEGVAGINPMLSNALYNQNMGGANISGFGNQMMNQGSALAGGSQSALGFANQAMRGQVGMPQMRSQGPESMGHYGQTPRFGNNMPSLQPTNGMPKNSFVKNTRSPLGTAFGAGNRYAGGVAEGGVAQGSGVDSGMANEMAGNAATMNPAAMGSASMNAAGMNAATNAGFNQDNLNNYINNDVLQGQIDAASRDVTRNLNENQLPSIQSQAAGSMNSGSSRIGNAIGVATRGAQDAIYDISSNMRGNAYSQGLGIEAGRANQNAAFQQAANQSNAGFQQGANQANANFMQDSMRTNAGFAQGANQYNAGAQNTLLSQGYGIGASQLENNLGRQQQGNQFDARSYNDARDFGSQIGANAFNNNMQNQQFGASLAATLGNQGTNNMNTGAQMFGFGNNMQMAAGQYGRDYQQQLYNQQFRQGMAPYQNLEFYNSIIGGPNNLSQATASSKGSSSGFNIGFGKKE